MMDERATDQLLADLFRRNAPSVDGPGLRARIHVRLLRTRRKSARHRSARAIALGFACAVLAGAVTFGAFEAADHLMSPAPLVFTELMPSRGDAAAGWGVSDPFGLARVSPLVGTMTVEQVLSEGAEDAETDENGIRWVRGRAEVYRLVGSQPSVDGTMQITMDLGTLPSGVIDVSGTWVLRTSRGAWEGSVLAGIVKEGGTDQFYFGKATGTGPFEGLLLLLEWHVSKEPEPASAGEGVSGRIEVSGWIQPAG